VGVVMIRELIESALGALAFTVVIFIFSSLFLLVDHIFMVLLVWASSLTP